VRPEQITALVHETGALDRARRLAHEFVDRAKASLNGGGSTEYGRALLAVPDFILARDC
jgi:geranylgeranyl pyrophosphate synthase